MVDQTSNKKKMKRIKNGGACEFFTFPNGIIRTGTQFLTDKMLGGAAHF